MPEKMRHGEDMEPVHDHPESPVMKDGAPEPVKIGGKVLTMPVEPKIDTGKRNRMEPFEKGRPRKPRAVYAEQEPLTGEPRGDQVNGQTDDEGYVRLRVRVTDRDVTVVGAKAVEGPLVEGRLDGELAYEVMVGEKRIAAGSVPDAGVRRSFPDPEASGEMSGHHISELPSYDVTVRVPRARVSRSAMSRMEIAVYRVKEELPESRIEQLPERSIGQQFGRQLREVGRVKGIRPDRLSKRAAQQVRSAFQLE